MPVPVSAASAQMAARHLLNRKTGLLANFRCRSFASVWPRTDDFRSTPINRHRYRASACLKCARGRHERATSAAPLPCRLSPSTIREGGVLLAREQRRLAAIVTADVAGYSHAAYEQIEYSPLMPQTYLSVRRLEAPD